MKYSRKTKRKFLVSSWTFVKERLSATWGVWTGTKCATLLQQPMALDATLRWLTSSFRRMTEYCTCLPILILIWNFRSLHLNEGKLGSYHSFEFWIDINLSWLSIRCRNLVWEQLPIGIPNQILPGIATRIPPGIPTGDSFRNFSRVSFKATAQNFSNGFTRKSYQYYFNDSYRDSSSLSYQDCSWDL